MGVTIGLETDSIGAGVGCVTGVVGFDVTGSVTGVVSTGKGVLMGALVPLGAVPPLPSVLPLPQSEAGVDAPIGLAAVPAPLPLPGTTVAELPLAALIGAPVALGSAIIGTPGLLPSGIAKGTGTGTARGAPPDWVPDWSAADCDPAPAAPSPPAVIIGGNVNSVGILLKTANAPMYPTKKSRGRKKIRGSTTVRFFRVNILALTSFQSLQHTDPVFKDTIAAPEALFCNIFYKKDKKC